MGVAYALFLSLAHRALIRMAAAHPHRTVRDQAFKAIDMFVKKCEALTAHMVRPSLSLSLSRAGRLKDSHTPVGPP